MHAIVGIYGSAEFSIEPAEGWAVSEVLVDGKPHEIQNGILKLNNLIGKHTVRVIFIPLKTVTLKVHTEGCGTVDHTGTESYIQGDKTTVNITPDEGYVVDDVLLNGKSVGSTNYLPVIMDSDYSLDVIFRKAVASDPTVDVSVDVKVGTVTGAYYGTISPSGPVRVAYGGSLTVTISLNEGYKLKTVTVDGKDMGALSVATVDNITKDIGIDVEVFTDSPKAYEIVSTSNSGGSISPSGTLAVNEGDDVTFTITPRIGYHLQSLTVDGKSVSATGKYTFSDVRSNHTISAVFAVDTPDVRMTSISVSDSPEYCYLTDTLDTSGMTVRAVYSNGSSYIVTGYSVDQRSWTTPGEKTVAVSYGGFTSTFTVTVPTLSSITVTTPPAVTVFAKGASINLSGIVLTANYSENTYDRVITGYTFTPQSFSETGNKEVAISYSEGTKTCTVTQSVTVVEAGVFSAKVTSYSGTKVTDGKTVSFSSTPNKNLKDFTFDMNGIVPGITQTITLKITNDTLTDLNACIFVSSVEEGSSSELAEQIILSSGAEKKSVSEAAKSSFLSLGTINSGGEKEITITLSFPHSEHNNEVMGKNLGFSLGVIADN